MSETPTAPNPDAARNAHAHANGTLDLVARGARDGAADARAAAERAWETAGLFVSRFVYTASYSVSYGVVFSSTLIARSVPRDNAAVRGLIDGAHAAIARVDDLRSTSSPAEPAALPAV